MDRFVNHLWLVICDVQKLKNF